MSDEEYPEARPSNLPRLDSFKFSLAKGHEAKVVLEARIREIDEGIDTVVKSVVIDEMPILIPLLKFTTDPENLEAIGKALIELGPRFRELNKLRVQVSALELAESEPNFFPAVFGEFDTEFSDFPDSISFTDAPPTTPKTYKAL